MQHISLRLFPFSVLTLYNGLVYFPYLYSWLVSAPQTFTSLLIFMACSRSSRVSSILIFVACSRSANLYFHSYIRGLFPLLSNFYFHTYIRGLFPLRKPLLPYLYSWLVPAPQTFTSILIFIACSLSSNLYFLTYIRGLFPFLKSLLSILIFVACFRSSNLISF